MRREAAKGRLVIEVIAGKHFTTLAALARIRELCHRETRAPPSQDRASTPSPGLIAQAALRALLGSLAIKARKW